MQGLLDLGSVTTSLLSLMRELSEHPVGDGIAPEAAGWLEGTPNSASGFVPYLVLSALSTSSLSPATLTPLCTTHAARFDMSYRLMGYGASREQSDAVSAVGREVLDAVAQDRFGVPGLLVSQLWFDVATGANRDDSAYPQIWASGTTFRVSMAIKR